MRSAKEWEGFLPRIMWIPSPDTVKDLLSDLAAAEARIAEVEKERDRFSEVCANVKKMHYDTVLRAERAEARLAEVEEKTGMANRDLEKQYMALVKAIAEGKALEPPQPIVISLSHAHKEET